MSNSHPLKVKDCNPKVCPDPEDYFCAGCKLLVPYWKKFTKKQKSNFKAILAEAIDTDYINMLDVDTKRLLKTINKFLKKEKITK